MFDTLRGSPRLSDRLRDLLGRGRVLPSGHGPTPARVRGRPAVPGRSPTCRRGAWAWTEYAFVQSKMFKDPGAAIMHAGIFWGFVLLTIGTADIVTGGIIQSVLKIPADGLIWTLISAIRTSSQCIVLFSIGWAFYRRLVSKPRRLTFNTDALIILGMIGGVVATELFAQVFQVAAYGPDPRCLRLECAGRATANLSFGILARTFHVLWWGHIALVAAFLCYLPFSKHLHIATAFPNIYFRKLAPPRGAAQARPRGRERDVRAQDAPGPRLEGPARWLHLYGVRSLPGGLSGLQHREAAQSQGIDHGHSPHVGDRRARDRHHPELADRARHRSGLKEKGVLATALAKPIVDDAIPYDAVWDCVTCGAWSRRVRPHRTRRQDRRAAPEPRLEESRFPSELTAAFRSMENQGNPGASRLGATRLDEAARVRGARRVGRGGRRLGRLEVLYWVGCAAAFDTRNQKVAGAVRRPAAAGVPSRSSARRSRAPATQPAGWATTTSSRCSRWAMWRRSTGTDGGTDDRDGLPALLQHHRQRVRPAGRDVQGRPPLAVPCRPSVRATATMPEEAGVDRRPPAGEGHRRRLVLSRPV